jgi:hypothetical protein
MIPILVVMHDILHDKQQHGFSCADIRASIVVAADTSKLFLW